MISSSRDIIDLVGTSQSLRKMLWVAMVTIHFHIAQTSLFMGYFFAFREFQGQYSTNSKLSFGFKVGQIRSWGNWIEAEISLFMMFVYVFTLFIRL